MNKYIADTMAFVLWLEKRKMPKKIKDKFDQAVNGQVQIIVPAMVFAEIAYLSERKKIDTTLNDACNALEKYPGFKEQPLTFSVVREAFMIKDIPELHDRLIAATGKEHNITVLTNDWDIHKSKHIKAIWK